MAAVLWRSLSSLRRVIFPSAVRCAGGPPSKPEDIHKGKVPTSTCEMPDSLGHSVGIERQELLLREAGNDDPFEMNVKKRGKSTFEEPTIVKSSNKKRMIGCIWSQSLQGRAFAFKSIDKFPGEEESLIINWLWLYKGEPKRCECGYWFKLVDS